MIPAFRLAGSSTERVTRRLTIRGKVPQMRKVETTRYWQGSESHEPLTNPNFVRHADGTMASSNLQAERPNHSNAQSDRTNITGYEKQSKPSDEGVKTLDGLS